MNTTALVAGEGVPRCCTDGEFKVYLAEGRDVGGLVHLSLSL